MKKRLLLLLVLVISIVGITACGGDKEEKETDGVGTEDTQKPEDDTNESDDIVDGSDFEVTEPITITWWHALEEQYQGVVDEVVNGFNESQDLITVEAEYVGSYSDVNEALVAAHAAGTGLPAITVANTPYVADYGSSGLSEPLDAYIKATDFDIEDFGMGLIDATNYEDKQVALPFLISTQIIYYNKDMATELGVTFPTQFADMEEFLEKVAVVNDGTTERYGTIIPGWDQWYFETFFLNNGVNIVNEDGLTTDLDGEAALETAKTLQSWVDNGYAYWASGTDASSIMRQNFIDEKAFSVLHTSSLYDTYVDRCDFEVGMAWYPGGETHNSEIGGSMILIPSKNDQDVKNAAWEFLTYLTSSDVNMTWANGTGYMPTRKSVLETEEADTFLEQKPAFEAIFDNLDLITPRIQHTAWSQLVEVWKSYMAETVIEGLDMEKQTEYMVEEINELLGDQ